MSKARDQIDDIYKIDGIESNLSALDTSTTTAIGNNTTAITNVSTDLGNSPRLIQRTEVSNIPGDIEMTTSYAWLPNNNKSFTPLRSDTVIVVNYATMMTYAAGAFIGSFRFYNNGVEDSSYRHTWSAVTGQMHFNFPEYRVASWGAGVARSSLGWKGREYGSGHTGSVGRTNHFDGAGTDIHTRVDFVIEEWLMPQ